jgi:hypothetical protein
MLDETVPLIGAPAFAGPPVIFLAGPWLLLTLMLTGPFLLLVTLALLATILVAIPAAILAPPYLLVHRLRQTSKSRQSRRPLPDARRERDSVTVGFVTQRTGTRLIAGPAAHAPAAAQLRNHT